MKWVIEPSATPGLYSVYDEEGNRVARSTTYDRARLIAAAPALLAALEAIIEAVDDEWQGPPFNEPMLTDRDHALLEQACAALAGVRGGEAGDG